MAKIMSDAWKKLRPCEKAPYELLAAQEKRRYALYIAEYNKSRCRTSKSPRREEKIDGTSTCNGVDPEHLFFKELSCSSKDWCISANDCKSGMARDLALPPPQRPGARYEFFGLTYFDPWEDSSDDGENNSTGSSSFGNKDLVPLQDLETEPLETTEASIEFDEDDVSFLRELYG